MSPLNSGGGTFQLFIEIFIPLYLYRLSTRGCTRERERKRESLQGEAARKRERNRGGREESAGRGTRGRVRPIVPEYEYNNENGFRRRSASPLLVLRLRSRDFFSRSDESLLSAPQPLRLFLLSAPTLVLARAIPAERVRAVYKYPRSAVTTTKPDACHCAC